MSDCPEAMFHLCIPVVAQWFVLVAIIIGGIAVFMVFWTACGIKSRRLTRERQARIEQVELQLRDTAEQVSRDAAVAAVAVAEAGVIIRDFAAAPAYEEAVKAQVEEGARKLEDGAAHAKTQHKSGGLFEGPLEDADAITPTEPKEPTRAHVRDPM